MDLMTAGEMIELYTFIRSKSLPSLTPTLANFASSKAAHLCPIGIQHRTTIVEVLTVARMFQSKALLQMALTRLVTGAWGNRLRLQEWTNAEFEDVGRGLRGVLYHLVGVPGGIRHAIDLKVDVTAGE
jgi:hypothetical protein